MLEKISLWFYFTGFLMLLILCLLSFFSANEEEPSLSHKELFIQRIQAQCPFLPWITLNNQSGAIIKPAHASSVKRGVKLGEWSKDQCQESLQVPCMSQAYHSGPWEVRLYKSWEWSPAVMWLAQYPSTESTNSIANFPWIEPLQKCIDKALPQTHFMAIDVRTNGNDLLVLEVNGVAGMPYTWTSGETSLGRDFWSWMYQRFLSGLNNLSLDRTIKILMLLFQRQQLVMRDIAPVREF
jgi:hypothetical protein